jgi:hypothetical protein
MKTFNEISKEIIDLSREYEEIDPDIARVFQDSFFVFLQTMKEISKCSENNEKGEISAQIKSRVFNTLFGDMSSCSTTGTSGGFNPNSFETANGINTSLLASLKNNINNIRSDMKKNSEDITNKLKEG